MALSEPENIGTGADVSDTDPGATAFLEQSYLTYIIPFATQFNPKEALQQSGGSVESNIANVEQRDQLFFGMRFANCPNVIVYPLLIHELQMRPWICTSFSAPRTPMTRQYVPTCAASS